MVNGLSEGTNVRDRGVVGDPVAYQPLGILAPEFMVALDNFLRQLPNRLAIDLHDDSVGGQIVVHPVEREALFHVECVIRILIKDDSGQKSVDRHHRDLS